MRRAAALGSKAKLGFQTCLQRTRRGLTPMWLQRTWWGLTPMVAAADMAGLTGAKPDGVYTARASCSCRLGSSRWPELPMSCRRRRRAKRSDTSCW
jgi:hypothetical protein